MKDEESLIYNDSYVVKISFENKELTYYDLLKKSHPIKYNLPLELLISDFSDFSIDKSNKVFFKKYDAELNCISILCIDDFSLRTSKILNKGDGFCSIVSEEGIVFILDDQYNKIELH
ncbi:hypothetical protein [Flammeovirga sp. SubArs3]|uniref:hypothetical protein n=1 Tax=Flammeovirga sp. SubArs3 TaxID=2995316 RepID=UPI00248C813B|nr:hypothetical protein [Flammeovirga sp. SubArs3]